MTAALLALLLAAPERVVVVAKEAKPPGFFEKLEKKEKGKPGTLSKLFGTHPPTPDRITKVHDLLVRTGLEPLFELDYPDKKPY